MQKCLNVSFAIHPCLKFDQELAWSPCIVGRYITPTKYTLTFHTTMNNVHLKFMAWEILLYKPRGNIRTEVFRITVSEKMM